MNKVASILGIDPQAAADVPTRIGRQVFFDTLAKLGVSPADEQQALDLLLASDNLEAKRAAFAQAYDPVNRSLRLLLGTTKQAAAPAAAIQSVRPDEVSRKVGEFLQDPYIYGAMLTNLTN